MRHDRGEQNSKPQAMRQPTREAFVKRAITGMFAAALAMSARRHRRKASRRSSLAASSIVRALRRYHRHGLGVAAKMAVEDFGGEVLGRKVQIVAADHLDKADLAASIARDMLDNQGVEMYAWRRRRPRWQPARFRKRATRS